TSKAVVRSDYLGQQGPRTDPNHQPALRDGAVLMTTGRGDFDGVALAQRQARRGDARLVSSFLGLIGADGLSVVAHAPAGLVGLDLVCGYSHGRAPICATGIGRTPHTDAQMARSQTASVVPHFGRLTPGDAGDNV